MNLSVEGRVYFGNDQVMFTEKRASFLKLPQIRDDIKTAHTKLSNAKTDKTRKKWGSELDQLEKQRKKIFTHLDTWDE